jgi:LAS superfamily LD-carboxypeptidase LdcB
MPKDRRTIVDYDTLMNSLDLIEKDFASRIFDIDPKDLGFKGPFYSMKKPYDLVEIPSVKVGYRETGIQYCPEHSYKDYLKMAAQMKKDIGRKLYIDSGYRSPGRQAYLFFHYLTTSSKYSLKENAKWIAMPGYSQHGSPRDNAVDFCTQDGVNGFSDHQTGEDFAKLPEYKWMLKNASKYNFYLSYPKDNKWGVGFEPWHWHWEIK